VRDAEDTRRAGGVKNGGASNCARRGRARYTRRRCLREHWTRCVD
jgi:hypothetical protein